MLGQIVVVVLVWTYAAATPSGDHTCFGVIKHPVTVKVNVTEPVQFRTYTWCLRVPPRCTKYIIQLRERVKVQTEMHNKTITVCCKGYVEMDYKCVPACPPMNECPNMKCNRTNHCHCIPGYTGVYCNSPCPSGVWGKDCKRPCDCPEGYTCHHLTGDCMLDDTPPQKKVKITRPPETTEALTTVSTTTTTRKATPPPTTTRRTTIPLYTTIPTTTEKRTLPPTTTLPTTTERKTLPPSTTERSTLPPTTTTTKRSPPTTVTTTTTTEPTTTELTTTTTAKTVPYNPPPAYTLATSPKPKFKPVNPESPITKKTEEDNSIDHKSSTLNSATTLFDPSRVLQGLDLSQTEVPRRKNKSEKKRKGQQPRPTMAPYDEGRIDVTDMSENSVETNTIVSLSQTEHVRIISDNDEISDSEESTRLHAEIFKRIEQNLTESRAAGVQAERGDDVIIKFLSGFSSTLGSIVVVTVVVMSIVYFRKWKKNRNQSLMEEVIRAYAPSPENSISPLIYANANYSVMRLGSEQATFFCPTFTTDYIAQLNKELCEMNYDHPRSTSIAEPLYAEIQN